MPHQLDDIIDILTELDQNRVARFSYTETAFNNDEIDGVAAFNAANEQNIPLDSLTDYEPLVLDKGLRAQGASIPRMAFNHFLGRLSFNVNKFVQRMLVAVGLMRTKLAQDANKYDADLTYQQGDICFVVSVSGTVTTVSYYVCLVADTVGITPGSDPSYWRPISVDLSNNKSFVATKSLIPVYSLVDLTSGSYSSSNWYPVVSSAAGVPNLTNGLGITNAVIDVYGEHSSGKAQLIVETNIGGAANFDYDIVKANRALNSGGTPLTDANNPIGYSRLVLGRQRVVWLKGGARYMIYNTAGLTFTAHTSAYDNGQDAPVSPGAARVFSPVYQRVAMRAVVPTTLVDDEAPNYAQLAALANIAITGDDARGTTAISDANAPTKSGFYRLTGGPTYTNSPISNSPVLIIHKQESNSDGNATQIATIWGSSQMFFRRKLSGVWSNWFKLWNEDNDGPGSGLDADLLDGLHLQSATNADPDGAAILRSGAFGLGVVATSVEFPNSSLDDFTIPTGIWRVPSTKAGTWPGTPNNSTMLVLRINPGQVHQLLFKGAGTAANEVYFRGGNNSSGGWGPWRTLWNSGLQGAGSGLDADTVDGIQGSSIVQTSGDQILMDIKTSLNTLAGNQILTNSYMVNSLVGKVGGLEYSISGMSGPTLAGGLATDFAYIDSTNDELQMFRVSSTGIEPIGSSFAVSGSIHRLASMGNGTDFALMVGNSLRMMRFNYSTLSWSQVGSTFTLPSFGSVNGYALAYMQGSRVAAYYNTGIIHAIRTIEFSGSSWSQVGNPVNVAFATTAAMAESGPDSVFGYQAVWFLDVVNGVLEQRFFDGTDWNDPAGTAISDLSLPAMTNMGRPLDIAIYDPGFGELRLYRNSVELDSISVTDSLRALTKLGSGAIVAADSGDDKILVYRSACFVTF